MTIAVINLRTVLIIWSEVVRLEMSVRDAVRVITVRLVHMFGRKRPPEGDQGRQNESDDELTASMQHAV